MSMTTDLTATCSQAAGQAFRLAADPVGTYRAGSLLLRGAPSVAAWFAGWLTTEFTPQVLTGHALSAVSSPYMNRITCDLAAQRADTVLDEALSGTFGGDYRDEVLHPVTGVSPRPSVAGFWNATQHRRRYASTTCDISYGPNGRDNLLDIWRLPELPTDRPAPVLLNVPGGAWSISMKRPQAYPLMSRLVELGWICVSINYCRSPYSPWPSHVVDVKRAIAWVRDNIAQYGGDPDFIAISGGSAGGHLAALAALTADDPGLQPGFEDADTTVQAAVPYYGVYDLTNTGTQNPHLLPFVEQFVMKARLDDNRELFESASPIYHARPDAPPFFLLHGHNDAVIPSEQADGFAAALRAAGAPTVCHADLPNAHHAFDILATVRAQLTAEAVADFLGIAYGRHALAPAGRVDSVGHAG